MGESTYAVRQIENGRTEMDFPSSSGGVTTIFHPFIRGNYQTIFNPKNFKKGVRMPTSVDIADFVHAIFCGPEKFRKNHQAEEGKTSIMSHVLFVPVILIYTPSGYVVGGKDRFGVYAVLDKNGVREKIKFNPNKLETRLSQGKEVMPGVILADGVSFAHRDTYRDGDQTPEELAKSGYIVATYTPEGAEKLAEASKRFSYRPHVWVMETPTKVVRNVSSIFGSDKLNAYGYYGEDNDFGFSFGVKK